MSSNVARSRLQSDLLRSALHATADALDYHSEIELLLVGGAAGMLTGLLSPARTTHDCDVMVYAPPQAWHAVETAARLAARKLHLGSSWLNSDAQLLHRRLPVAWKSRRITVGRFGSRAAGLLVHAIGRPDFIAMKFIAGRVQDREDLASLRITAAEAAFVRDYLSTLASRGEHPDHIANAADLLNAMNPPA